MKFISFLIFLSAASKLSGQIDSMLVNATPTSVEEYNFLIKGYKIQVESGLDMKKGYYFEDVGVHEIGDYHFTIKNLMREQTLELAGILIITYSPTTGITYYTGIPINNPKLLDQYAQDISKWHGGMQKSYSYLIAAYLSTGFYNQHKAR